MKKIKIRKKPIIIILIMFAILHSTYLIARYASGINGSSSKPIAKWTVKYNDCGATQTNCTGSTPVDIVAQNGTENDTGTQDYVLKIESTSEASASYKIILSNVPTSMQVRICDGPVTSIPSCTSSFVSPTNNSITFTDNSYKINVSDVTKVKMHTLTFKVPLGSSISATSSIGMDVKFEQID